MILLPSGAFVSPLPSGCECQVQKKRGVRRRIRDGAETGSSAVSSAAVRHSPSDLQPKTALSLLERRTIPRVEEGPGGWVCVGAGGEEEEERTGGCFRPLCRRSTDSVRMETPVRAGGLSRPETARTPKPGCVLTMIAQACGKGLPCTLLFGSPRYLLSVSVCGEVT